MAGLNGIGLGGRTARAQSVPTVNRRKLGRIGVEVSILGLGLGSAFTRPFVGEAERGHALLKQALDAGINYWDTSHNYAGSEITIAPVVERHRDRIFLVSKSAERSYEGFRRELESSLHRLKTDRIDLYHLHNLKPTDDLAAIETGACRAARRAKEEGLIGAYGVTGHSGARVLMEAIERFDPDALLTIFPADRPDGGSYEDELLPLAIERNLGIVGMKTVRHARNSDLRGTDLIRYALSLTGVSSVIVGLDTEAHLSENVAMASNFQPMESVSQAAMSNEVRSSLTGTIAPWNVPGYEDGRIA